MRATDPFITCLLALGVVGCGGGDSFPIAPVTGKVTLNGQPLADARVIFHSTSAGKDVGPDSGGLTDAQGNYSLTTVDGRTGATVGTNSVRISTLKMAESENKSLKDANRFIRMRHGESVAVPEKVPFKYNKEAALQFTVPKEGTNAANFDLTGEPPPMPDKKGAPPKGLVGPKGDKPPRHR